MSGDLSGDKELISCCKAQTIPHLGIASHYPRSVYFQSPGDSARDDSTRRTRRPRVGNGARRSESIDQAFLFVSRSQINTRCWTSSPSSATVIVRTTCCMKPSSGCGVEPTICMRREREIDHEHGVIRDQAAPSPQLGREEIRAGDRAPVRLQKHLRDSGIEAPRPSNETNTSS